MSERRHDTPLRVLFVVPGDGRGSSMIFVRRQRETLLRDGVEVDSFYLRSRTAPAILAREFLRLRRSIAQFRPALIHAQFGTMTAMVAALAAGALPLVITYRGGDLNRTPRSLRSALGCALSQLAALRAQRIVCVSGRLRDRLWWRRGRVTVLASGVDSELFRPEPKPAARGRLEWPNEASIVLFNAGHDPRNKRLDLARAAAEVARERRPGLRLEVLDGQTDPALIPTFMNASDCLLITSDAEGSPTVLQEALACALPVVSVDVGDAAERLRGIAPSRLVPRDAQVIGRVLAEITASPARTNGPVAAETLSLRRTAQALREVYAAALSRRGAA